MYHHPYYRQVQPGFNIFPIGGGFPGFPGGGSGGGFPGYPGGGFVPPPPLDGGGFGGGFAPPPPPLDGGGFGGGSDQYAAPTSPPPAFTPQQNISTFAVDPGAIRRCRFRFTYIWLTNGRSFWFYPTFVGRDSIAGFRWRNNRWVYYGTDLQRISSFQCGGF